MSSSQDGYSDKELSYWLAFDHILGAGLSVAKIKRLKEVFFSLENAWGASRSDLQDPAKQLPLSTEGIDKIIEQRPKIEPLALVHELEALKITAYPFDHDLYPTRLREIHDPPLVLYHKGKLSLEDSWNAVAVVGSRHPTAYGQKLAKEFAHGLAASGVTVISGMAFGIDSFAHRAALEANGKTMAVFGCGVDVCYPSSNRPLYKMLTEEASGCCLSEFYPGIKPEPWRFPTRNRIISGMTAGCLVIEAGEASGSLITARLAFEQNRDVFSIPGRIDSPMSIGTNKLIADMKAQLVTSYEQVLQHLGWTSSNIKPDAPIIVELYGREKDVFQLITGEPVHFDMLCDQTGMGAGELSATLTMLELAGVVNRLPGDWYARN
jgi:DNA processing protein